MTKTALVSPMFARLTPVWTGRAGGMGRGRAHALLPPVMLQCWGKHWFQQHFTPFITQHHKLWVISHELVGKLGLFKGCVCARACVCVHAHTHTRAQLLYFFLKFHRKFLVIPCVRRVKYLRYFWECSYRHVDITEHALPRLTQPLVKLLPSQLKTGILF